MLKVLRLPGDEWRSGEVLEAFGGKAVVRVYDYVEGAELWGNHEDVAVPKASPPATSVSA